MSNLNELMETIYQINVAHGWFDSERSFGDDIALLNEESSEAYREYRKGHDLDKIYGECKNCGVKYKLLRPDFRCTTCDGPVEPKGVPVELIDVIIRALDSLKRAGIADPQRIMEIKCEYNSKRPYRHGNKVT